MTAAAKPEIDVEDDGTVIINPGGRRADPVARAIHNGLKAEADELEEALDTIRGLMGDSTRLLLYRRTPGGGAGGAYVATLDGSDLDNLMDHIRQEHGGGKYQIKIQVDGKIRQAKSFEIEGAPIVKGQDKKGDGDSLDLMKILLDQLKEKPASGSNDLAMQMLQMQITQQKQNTTTMVSLVTGLAPVLVALLTQKSEGPAAMLQAMAPYISQPKEPEGNKLGEMLGLLETAKALVAGSAPADGGGASGFMDLAAKFAPAILKGLEQQAAAQGQQQPAQPAQIPYQPPRPDLGPPPPRPAMPGAPGPRPAAPGAPQQEGPRPLQPYMADPVLALVGEDVLFMARRKYDPALAAEAVLDLVSKAGIAESDLLALVVRFNASSDWVAELRIQGLDLSPYGDWSAQFMAELVAAYTEQQHDDPNGDSGRPSGGADNP